MRTSEPSRPTSEVAWALFFAGGLGAAFIALGMMVQNQEFTCSAPRADGSLDCEQEGLVLPWFLGTMLFGAVMAIGLGLGLLVKRLRHRGI